MSRSVLLSLVALLAAIAPAHASDPTVAIAGTGATFPAKVYQQWADNYSRDTGVKVAYQPSGSSAGVKQIVARAVDFGATDVPMSAADLDKHQLFQFPTLVGGLVPVVNLPGVAPGALRLNAETLAAVFAGRITRWNDREIAALNPQLALADLRITRVVRADGSGSTEVFVAYLKAAAPAAAEPIEAQGSKARWPGTPLAVEGSSKVSAAVKTTAGAIGYVSSDYVVRDNLSGVSLRNHRGEWVSASLDAYRAAIRAGQLFHGSMEAAPLIDLDGPGVWPIVTATYVLVPRSPQSAERAARTLNFFYQSFLLGDKAVAGTGFAPLPVAVQARIVSQLANFRMPDGRLLPVLGASESPQTAMATP